MQYRKGITAVIRSLGGGGAERVLTNLLNSWAERGVPVSLITTTLVEEYAYEIHPEIHCVTIAPIRTPGNLDDCPWNVRHLRQAITMERNQTVLSFMEKSNIPCVLATSGLPVRLILSERTDPRTQEYYSDYKKALVRRLYPLADMLVVQTQSVKKWAQEFLPDDQIKVIRNMVTITSDNEVPYLNLPKKFICCMGRMTTCKGLPGMIDQLPKIFKKFPEHHLVILGDGPDRQSLKAQISALGLTERVRMPGFIANPHVILQKADLFVLPSIFEGFPNALIEAMELGVTPISFDCLSGPAEIITHGENGILVPPQDYQTLGDSIIDLLSNPEKCSQLAQQAQTWTNKNCNTQKIMQKWDEVCQINSFASA